MNNPQNIDQNVEIEKVRQLLAKNIDEFKYLALFNMRLEQKNMTSKETLRLNMNRISDYQQNTEENLEEWVKREFAPKSDKKEEGLITQDESSETLEQWVARLRSKSKKNKSFKWYNHRFFRRMADE